MATRKHNTIVIGISLIIAIAISFIQWKKSAQPQAESRIFKVTNGWGYDILVNNQVRIHQVCIPVLQSLQPFETKEQAEATAQLVLKRVNQGSLPTLTKSDLETILPAYVLENGQHGKHQ